MNDRAELWLQKQTELLLPTPYFLITFTPSINSGLVYPMSSEIWLVPTRNSSMIFSSRLLQRLS
jgi:hypothetical protein